MSDVLRDAASQHAINLSQHIRDRDIKLLDYAAKSLGIDKLFVNEFEKYCLCLVKTEKDNGMHITQHGKPITPHISVIISPARVEQKNTQWEIINDITVKEEWLNYE